MSNKRLGMSLAALLLLASGASQAAMVSVELDGVIDGLGGPPSQRDLTLFGPLADGQAYHVRFEYDTVTPDGDADPNVGVYYSAITSASLTINGRTLSFAPTISQIRVSNDIDVGTGVYSDGMSAEVRFGEGSWSYAMWFDVADTGYWGSAPPLTSDRLGPFGDLARWRQAPGAPSLTFWGCDSAQPTGCTNFRGPINNMVSPVPLPAAAWLLAPAVLGLFGFGKRRRA